MPLDLFSELRPVTSLFVQLQLTAGISTVDIRTLIHDASRKMLEILCPHKGKINKIVLFDKVSVWEQSLPPTLRGWAVRKRERLPLRHCSKMCCIRPWQGCMFLCVFGLSGEKLPYESIHALQSAIQIFNSCSTMLMEVE